MSDHPRTVGAICENWRMALDKKGDGMVLYTLGKKNGGNARKPTKSSVWKRKEATTDKDTEKGVGYQVG